MPNVASILKSEIMRIARKEIRAEVESLKKSVTSHRSEIAALKRRSEALEKEWKRVHKSVPQPASAPIEETGKAIRFSAKRLAAQRQRLGLSADAVGLLVGTSGQVGGYLATPLSQHIAAIKAEACVCLRPCSVSLANPMASAARRQRWLSRSGAIGEPSSSQNT